MTKIRVLLVEDNRLLREGIAAMLNEQPDIRAVAATGNGDALSKAKKLKPQVVLLDIGLRSQSSLHVVQSIKELFPKAQVIVMDLVPIHAEVVPFLNAGVSGFILKDATLDDFLHTIRAVAEGKKVLPPRLTDSLFSEVVEHALQHSDPDKLLRAVKMTKREHEVVALIAGGRSNKEIAAQMHISVHTVKSHVHNILEKLALHTRLEVASFVHEKRLAESPASKPRTKPGKSVHRKD
jgi:DNA-binding NarL/FixJ family response regulator